VLEDVPENLFMATSEQRLKMRISIGASEVMARLRQIIPAHDLKFITSPDAPEFMANFRGSEICLWCRMPNSRGYNVALRAFIRPDATGTIIEVEGMRDKNQRNIKWTILVFALFCLGVAILIYSDFWHPPFPKVGFAFALVTLLLTLAAGVSILIRDIDESGYKKATLLLSEIFADVTEQRQTVPNE
jgi:hypothetical protein